MRKKLLILVAAVLIGCSAAEPVEFDLGEVKVNYVLGPPSALVQVTEFTDYECEYCGEFHRDVFPKIKVKYIDAGWINYQIKDFPITPVHKYAFGAAKGAYCAGDQERYWQFIDYVFENQANLKVDDLLIYAEAVGVADLEKFEACVRSDKYDRTIEDNMVEGANRDLKGPPTFFVNGQRIDGVRDFEYWDEKLSELLEPAKEVE